MPPVILSLAAGCGLILGLLGGSFLAVSKIKMPAPHVAPEPKASMSSAIAPHTFEDFSKIAAELDSWRRELTERNNKALLLDAELAKREQVLQAERGALDQERSRLEKVQKDMEDRLIKIKENEAPRLQEIADLYSTMKPDDAVTLLRALPPEQATKVVTLMKQKVAAKLLSLWIDKFPADKSVVAQLTNDLVRTINEPAAGDGAAPSSEGGAASPTDLSSTGAGSSGLPAAASNP